MINLGTKIYRTDTVFDLKTGLYYYSNYPKVYIKYKTVNIESLDDSMGRVLEQLNRVAGEIHIKGFMVTSGKDSNHPGSENRTSLHYSGKGIDISFYEAITGKFIEGINVKWGSIYSKLYNFLNSTNLPTWTVKYDVVIESNHIHIEYDPRGLKGEKVIEAKEEKKESQMETVLEPLRYIHVDKGIKTVNDLLNKPLFSIYKDKLSELLNYKGKTTLTNKQRIESRYTKEDSFDMLKTGTVILLDPEKVDRDFLSRQSEGQVTDLTSFPMFLTEIREEIESSNGYSPSIDLTEDVTVEYLNSVASVWVYSKSLDMVIDITPLCNKINTTSAIPTSSFSIDLAYIEGVKIDDIFNNSEGENGVVNSIIENGISEFARILSPNDIIWIRFEQLDIEGERIGHTLEVNRSELANKYYDLIGLIDIASPSVALNSSTGVVSVTGQCLSKVFVDDEAIFFPLSVIKDSFTGNLIIGPSDNNKLIQRLFSDGTYYTKFAKSFRNIKDTLSYYINQLSQIGLIPGDQEDTFFESYKSDSGDRRTKLYTIKGENVEDKLQHGIYQIIKLNIDESIQNRTVADSSVSNPSGSLLSLFYKICQPPLVEFFFDTYKDTFNMVVRKPPFDEKSIKEWLKRGYTDLYVISDTNVQQESLFFENNFYTWFQIYNSGAFIGMNQQTALTYVPIVSLPEYVDLWGSKPLSVTSNYTVTNTMVVQKEKEQIIQDLLYLIESNMYLPFSRKGTIILNHGDRRIKKGSFIEYGRTSEIFYVEAVINSMSISGNQVSRSTTLQVSRGLKKRFVDRNVVVNGKEMSYFKIVDLKSLKETLEKYLQEGNRDSILKKVIVDPDVFKFFLEKKQMSDD